MAVAFKRMYVDLPADVHAKFQEKCASEGRPMKTVLEELIIQHTETKRGRKKRG